MKNNTKRSWKKKENLVIKWQEEMFSRRKKYNKTIKNPELKENNNVGSCVCFEISVKWNKAREINRERKRERRKRKGKDRWGEGREKRRKEYGEIRKREVKIENDREI